jgi:16S rRNA processing protein RimM
MNVTTFAEYKLQIKNLMEKDDCFYFGKVIKTHGIKGGISIRIDADNPADYSNISMLLIEINKSLIPYFITEKSFHTNKAYLSLVDVNTVEKAAELAGSNIFLPLELLPKLKGNQFYFHEVGGYKIVDRVHGELGNIVKVLEYPSQAVFQLFIDGKEVLIPIHDEVILKVDRRSKTIQINAPEGLIDMYLE